PRTAISTSVEVMSRGSVLSSISVPTSAGVMLLGGSYMGATDIPDLGSRPFVHQSPNITTKATSGKNTIGLLPRNQTALVNPLGDASTPLGMNTSTVSPPWA